MKRVRLSDKVPGSADAGSKSRRGTCVICQADFEYAPIGRTAITCSADCRAERTRRTMNALHATRMAAKPKGPPLAHVEAVLATWSALVAKLAPKRGGLHTDRVAPMLGSGRAPALATALKPFGYRGGDWTPRRLGGVLGKLLGLAMADGRRLVRRMSGGNLWAVVNPTLPPPPPPPPPVKKPRVAHNAGRYDFHGEQLTLQEIAARTGQSKHRLYMRIETLGWSVEKACQKPARKIPRLIKVEHEGRTWTLAELAAHVGITKVLLSSRLAAGMSVVEAATSKHYRRSKDDDDLTDHTYERWKVLGPAPDRPGRSHRYWYVQCSCGSPPRSVAGYTLVQGTSASCGCIKNEAAARRAAARSRRYDVLGQQLTMTEIVQLSGKSRTLIRNGMQRGLTATEAAFGQGAEALPVAAGAAC